ncbi:MutT/nudix family protein [Parvularcula bermudensis HTCC2503]|uniref:MutT/nudix family protein n=1 Tax=Parvularcula bermudensis (strain ATCC BAA-594 / HTCC2503 / KCTC 12087) TaxID=314260 RepID=E0TGN6_PARBH|nr:NUDIX domain-containing protein [Parvularcula bermudensis]ADM10168.1 MutT/nudix family protein [Parvularcula bermudensis HTCC2503]
MTREQGPIAAVGGVVFKGDDILLIQRARPPFVGHWSIPGGKIAYGEAMETALKREIAEETGVDVQVLGLINVFEALPEEASDRHFLLVDYACRYIGGTVRAADDAADAEFVPLNEALSRLSWDKTRLAIQGALPFRRQMS